jgi:hypothetical protein
MKTTNLNNLKAESPEQTEKNGKNCCGYKIQTVLFAVKKRIKKEIIDQENKQKGEDPQPFIEHPVPVDTSLSWRKQHR